MLYSVYNPQTSAYDYYQASGDADALPSPKHLRPKELGVPVTQAGWPLPPDARWVGRGDIAKGQVATPLGDAGLSSSTNTLALVALLGAAYLLWRKR
jgi:hypothetical protein